MKTLELEGTWEQILERESELRGKRLHVRVLDSEADSAANQRERRIQRLRDWVKSHDHLPELHPEAFHRSHIYADHD